MKSSKVTKRTIMLGVTDYGSLRDLISLTLMNMNLLMKNYRMSQQITLFGLTDTS